MGLSITAAGFDVLLDERQSQWQHEITAIEPESVFESFRLGIERLLMEPDLAIEKELSTFDNSFLCEFSYRILPVELYR